MKTTNCNLKIIAFVALILSVFSIPAHAVFILSFDSSPNSWVGQGES